MCAERNPTTDHALERRYRALLAQAQALQNQRTAILQEAAAIALQAGIPHQTRAQRWGVRSEEERYGYE